MSNEQSNTATAPAEKPAPKPEHRPREGRDREKTTNLTQNTAIFIRSGESIEAALKRFKRDCANAGIMSEVKRREFYEKPSTTKRRKVEAAKRKREKKRMMYLRRKDY